MRKSWQVTGGCRYLGRHLYYWLLHLVREGQREVEKEGERERGRGERERGRGGGERGERGRGGKGPKEAVNGV